MEFKKVLGEYLWDNMTGIGVIFVEKNILVPYKIEFKKVVGPVVDELNKQQKSWWFRINQGIKILWSCFAKPRKLTNK